MGEFTYNKVESNFSSWNLTRGSASLSEDRLFLVIPSCKTDPFCQGVTSTISAASDGAFAIKSLNILFTRFHRVNYQPLFSNHVGTFSRNYVTKKLQEGIRALGYKGNYTGHSSGGEQQRQQGWLGYRKKRYNYQEGGSQIAIVSMLRLTLTGYITHPEDTNFLEKHDFPFQDFLPARYLVHQPLTPSPPAPGPKSQDQVDVRRYSIYEYWGLGVRPGMYVAKVAV